MDKSNIDLSILKQHYEVNNKTEGKSPKTVSWYNEVLHLFLNYLKCQGMSTSLGDVGEWEVRQFSDICQASGYDPEFSGTQ